MDARGTSSIDARRGARRATRCATADDDVDGGGATEDPKLRRRAGEDDGG